MKGIRLKYSNGFSILDNLDKECHNDLDCASEKACIGGYCQDPCSMRGVCGTNALCKTVLHRPRCSCPNCYVGRPDINCTPDAMCQDQSTPRPKDPTLENTCRGDHDCHVLLRCDRNGQCVDPCDTPGFVCTGNKKCEARNHRPVCVCKSGFIVNEYGELVCAPDKRECIANEECASNLACIDGRCANPCVENERRGIDCPKNKSCQVQNHKPQCVCMKDCSPSVSICLRDNGCPPDLACVNYECVNPCLKAQCAEDSPCFVEDHRPVCKFCPAGFATDSKYGCQKGKIFLKRKSTQTLSSVRYIHSNNDFIYCKE